MKRRAKILLTASLTALLAGGALPVLAQGADGLRRDATDIADALGAAPETLGNAVRLSGAEADAALAGASAYLNGMGSVSGRFEQINANGTIDRGDFYIHRPGRMRFDYDDPSPLVVVADGRTVAAIDSQLETVDRTLLEETALSYLLKANIDLADDGQVASVAAQDGLVLIALDDPAGRVSGQLILIFADSDFTLREWVAIDPSGQQTRVLLTEVTQQASLDPDLFAYETGVRQGPPR